jgi:hypothetical protein
MVVELAGRIGDFACLSLQLESPLACCALLQRQGQSAFPATIALHPTLLGGLRAVSPLDTRHAKVP